MGTQTDAVGRRVLACLVDTMIVAVLMVGMFFLPVGISVVVQAFLDALGLSVASGVAEAVATVAGLFVLVWWLFIPFAALLYKVGHEARYGYTPGKRLFSLVVVGSDGSPIGWKESVARNAIFFILIGAPFVMVGMALSDDDAQRIGDQVADTTVTLWA